MKAVLALADGRYFIGKALGATGEVSGEVVFNTSMTGYQEILTDPSYHGEIVTMTYPQIGNYGINSEDVESSRPFLSGLVIKESCPFPSNFRSEMSLDDYLQQNNIVAIEGIDTRALVKHIRTTGAQTGIISSIDTDPQHLIEKAKLAPSIVGRDLVKEVTCSAPYTCDEGVWELGKGYAKPGERPFKVVAYDFGIKRNILRNLTSSGCEVTVVPAQTSADDVLAMNPDGIFLSNGPGDPEPLHYAQENIRKLIDTNIPIFGICLGHQLLSIALGGKTYKLKFGHRGGNQPVLDHDRQQVEITSQNHGFAVDQESLDDNTVKVTHINLNDNTVEGIAHCSNPAFSVQYHPEASPGPHDAHYLFDRFLELIKKHKA
jgi:carbamoyl-phosphate synthase small subunit